VADGGDGRCNADSCCYSKGAPAPAGYSQTGARCKVEEGQDDNSLGDELTGQTLDQCKAACDDKPQCVAFDFEPVTGECELKTAVNLVASVADGVADGGDGRCNADSCCYSKASSATTSGSDSTKAPSSTTTSGAAGPRPRTPVVARSSTTSGSDNETDTDVNAAGLRKLSVAFFVMLLFPLWCL